tara:strand:+ start:2598 stop:2855 length:258 start_codon:yes stop_codon:yes gene_type:complete
MKFEKMLSRSESKYKYIGIPKKIREENFPEKDKTFSVRFQDEIFQMSVNNKNCIMLSQLYTKHKFQEGETLTIIKNKSNFEMSVV